jgi:hypothetical protein
MTREEFSAAAFILGGSWPGEFSANDEASYWHMLSEFEAADVMRALKAMRSRRFRPTPGELADALSAKAGIPSFDEMIRLVFGPGGVLAARAPRRGVSPAEVLAAWEAGAPDPGETVGPLIGQSHAEAIDAAQLERAATLHPLVASFVARQGLQRLRGYNVSDSAAGGPDGKRTDTWDRKELREAWAEHLDVQDGREVAALAAGTGAHGLRALDPLAALGIGEAPVQIGAGER